MTIPKGKILGIAVIALTMTGCTLNKKTQAHHKVVNDKVTEAQSLQPKVDSGLVRSPGYYLTDGRITPRKPQVLMQAIGVPGLIAKQSMTVADFAAHFSEHIGVPVDISSDVYNPREGESEGEGSTTEVTDSTGNTVTKTAVSTTGEAVVLPTHRYRVGAQETADQALSRIVGKYGLAWRYDDRDNRFVIYRYQTEVFDLPVSATKRDTTMSLSSGNITSEMKADRDAVQRILAAVEKLITDEGRVAVTDSGSIVVSDVPSSVSAIRVFIEKEQKKLRRQVLMQVALYTRDNNDSEGYDANWTMAFDDGHTKIDLGSSSSAITGGIETAIQLINPTSKFSGSKLDLAALAKSNDLSIAYLNNFITVSGAPITANQTRNVSYLKSITGTLSSSGDTVSRELEPGEVTTGLSMFLNPLVMGDEISVDMSFSLTSLIDLVSESSGTDRITVPETSDRDATQTVRLRNGGAVALTGFYVSTAETDDEGVGTSSFKLLGGSNQESQEMRKAILVVTASILE